MRRESPTGQSGPHVVGVVRAVVSVLLVAGAVSAIALRTPHYPMGEVKLGRSRAVRWRRARGRELHVRERPVGLMRPAGRQLPAGWQDDRAVSWHAEDAGLFAA